MTMPKVKSNVIVTPANTNVARGHMAHQSGAKTHGDRRLKRHKTRQQQIRHAFSGW